MVVEGDGIYFPPSLLQGPLHYQALDWSFLLTMVSHVTVFLGFDWLEAKETDFVSIDTDGMLSKALLVGNFEAAVDICISADRMVRTDRQTDKPTHTTHIPN